MEFFTKHKIIILRFVGVVILLIGCAVHFWSQPQKGVSVNEIAAANVARMEASIKGDTKYTTKVKSDMSTFTKALTTVQQERTRYITIFAMILGILFLGYSFIKKEED